MSRTRFPEPLGERPGTWLVESDRAGDDLELAVEHVHLLHRFVPGAGRPVTVVGPASQRPDGVHRAAAPLGVEEGAAAILARGRKHGNGAPEGVPLRAPEPRLPAALRERKVVTGTARLL